MCTYTTSLQGDHIGSPSQPTFILQRSIIVAYQIASFQINPQLSTTPKQLSNHDGKEIDDSKVIRLARVT